MIIAVDFDGTLFENAFPEIGKPRYKVINFILERKARGDTIILWTCRGGESLQKAVSKCKEYGIEFDYINENAAFDKALYKDESRKIYADLYLDDHAMNPSVLVEALQFIGYNTNIVK